MAGMAPLRNNRARSVAMKMTTLPRRRSGKATVLQQRPLSVEAGVAFHLPDFLDRQAQIAIPVDGVPGEVEVCVEDDHGECFMRGQATCHLPNVTLAKRRKSVHLFLLSAKMAKTA